MKRLALAAAAALLASPAMAQIVVPKDAPEAAEIGATPDSTPPCPPGKVKVVRVPVELVVTQGGSRFLHPLCVNPSALHEAKP